MVYRASASAGGELLARAEYLAAAGAARSRRPACRAAGRGADHRGVGGSGDGQARPAARTRTRRAGWPVPGNAAANPSPRVDRKPGWLTITMPSSAARAVQRRVHGPGVLDPVPPRVASRAWGPAARQRRRPARSRWPGRPGRARQTWNPRASNSRIIAVSSSRSEEQDSRAVRRDRVAAVDGRGAAAHPAVGPDLDRLGGQLAGPAALQAVREQPVHLVVHDQAVDPLLQRAGLRPPRRTRRS